MRKTHKEIKERERKTKFRQVRKTKDAEEIKEGIKKIDEDRCQRVEE